MKSVLVSTVQVGELPLGHSTDRRLWCAFCLLHLTYITGGWSGCPLTGPQSFHHRARAWASQSLCVSDCVWFCPSTLLFAAGGKASWAVQTMATVWLWQTRVGDHLGCADPFVEDERGFRVLAMFLKAKIPCVFIHVCVQAHTLTCD